MKKDKVGEEHLNPLMLREAFFFSSLRRSEDMPEALVREFHFLSNDLIITSLPRHRKDEQCSRCKQPQDVFV